MRLNNYIEKINLGEEDGAQNVLIKTSREVETIPEGQRPLATMKNTARILGVPLPTIYTWIYKGNIPYRRFKKRQSDRMGLILIPVRIALEFVRTKNQTKRPGYSHPWVREAVKDIKAIPEPTIEKFINDLHAIINRQAAQLGKWPTREMAKAYQALEEAKGNKEGANYEPAEVS